MGRLLKRHIDALAANGTDAFIWDSEIPGFGVRVKPTGRKTFVFQYRNAERISRRLTIGDYGPLTLDQARRKARDLRGLVQNGEDPVQAKRDLRNSPTVRELAARYMRDHCEGRSKQSTLAAHRWLLERIIFPALGERRVAFVEPADVRRLHESLAATPYNANRTIGLLRAMFNHGERWGMRPPGSNPTRHVKKYREQKRERFLTRDEFRRVLAAIDESERSGTIMPEAACALRLLFFTGCRLSEILTLRWDQVDLVGRCLKFADHKTDAKGMKSIPLNEPALVVLNGICRSEISPYVLPGKNPGSHLVNLQKPWKRVLRIARLAGVRIHDIRHTYASLGLAAGLSLPVIGGLLGHKSPQTTARYAHLSPGPLHQAAQVIGTALATQKEE
jgi:integrase